MAETVGIERLGHEGDGIAETSTGPLYVPFTLPGESVSVEIDGARGALAAILAPSPERTNPLCRHFGQCGGCALQHWADDPYSEWKRQQVVAALAQRGIAVDVLPLVRIPAGARRRAIFSAATTDEGAVLGFHRRASKEILAISECPILTPALVAALPMLRRLAAQIMGQRGAAQLTVLAADNGLDISAKSAAAGRSHAMSALSSFAASEPTIARLTVDGEELLRARLPELRQDGISLFPTPGGFVQASATAELVMAQAVAEALGERGPYADLFAGIGTFALRLAKSGPVLAVENEATALAALDHGARQTRGLKAITTRRRDLFRNPLAAVELKGFAGVVFDPPRAGAKAQAEALATSSVPRLAAISCNPASFSRDARILIDGGYRLISVLPVDQFHFSPHVELVAGFVR